MQRRLLPLGAAAMLVVCVAVAAADPVPFKIDPGHSLVGFNIRHFFSHTSGRFKDFSGTIMLDVKKLTGSSVEVTIQAASINTENERRDNDLRSANFFNTDTFPTITFKSTKVVLGPEMEFAFDVDLTGYRVGGVAYRIGSGLAPGFEWSPKMVERKKVLLVFGDLTIHGVTKPVMLEADVRGIGQVSMGGRPPRTLFGFEAKTTLNRKDFGVVWNQVLDQGGTMLGDEVAITLQIEAAKFDPNDPPPGQAPAASTPEKTPDRK